MKMFDYKLFLLCSPVVFYACNVKAVECMLSDCEIMGYTQTKEMCDGYDSVRCPFDLDKYFCSSSVCDDSYKYACSGTGYNGGAGYSCDGKYSSCMCASGYNWNGSACAKCDAKYNLACNSTGWKGNTTDMCGGYYASCVCNTAAGYCDDGKGNCTVDACKMDYTLLLNWTMPWGSCSGSGKFNASWTMFVELRDINTSSVISEAVITLSEGEIVNGGSRSVAFNNKILDGKYKMVIGTSFTNSTNCANGSKGIFSVVAGGNAVTLPISSDGVEVGLYKQNNRQIIVNAEFGVR